MTLAEFRTWILTDEGPASLLQAAIDYTIMVDIGLPQELVQERAIRLLYHLAFPEAQPVHPRQR
jgi:hypothetical protein